MRRHRDHIFQRPGSKFWAVRIQQNGKSKIKSLKTTDKQEAIILARPYVDEHQRRLLAARPRIETGIERAMTPGKYEQPDGSLIVAGETEITYIGKDGSVRSEPNRKAITRLVNNKLGIPSDIDVSAMFTALDDPKRTALAKNAADDDLFELYLVTPTKKRKKKLDAHSVAEARKMWTLFRSLIDKPLKDTTRDDARKIVTHLQSQGLKSATIRRKFVYLVATVAFGIKEGKLPPFNPFADLVEVGKDVTRREPLSDQDMAICWRELHRLSPSDQLAFRLLAATGMRLGEAFEIDHEKSQKGIRFCEVGTKTEASRRKVPFPASVLPHLPKKITGKLLDGAADGASGRLNDFLRDIGVGIRNVKVLYSLRHRAKDTLRAEECPEKIAEAIFGRDEVTMGDKYGVGFPVTVLKKWIDKILPIERLTTPAKSVTRAA